MDDVKNQTTFTIRLGKEHEEQLEAEIKAMGTGTKASTIRRAIEGLSEKKSIEEELRKVEKEKASIEKELILQKEKKLIVYAKEKEKELILDTTNMAKLGVKITVEPT